MIRAGRFCLAGLLAGLLAAPASAADRPSRVAIIIDDLGYSLALGERALDLPAELTYSVLPHRPYSREIARRAHRRGKEVMLHLPMESRHRRTLGPGGLYSRMARDEFTRVLQSGIASVPHLSGVNNHMGSLLTGQPESMNWLMEDLRCLGPLYFVDSRTDVRSVAYAMARDAGLHHGRRDIFLDHNPEPEAIRRQLRRLVAKARERGNAIAIGHPYPSTLMVLAEMLPGMVANGIQIVPVSRMVNQKRRISSWHACSSPLPTVARNSKP